MQGATSRNSSVTKITNYYLNQPCCRCSSRSAWACRKCTRSKLATMQEDHPPRSQNRQHLPQQGKTSKNRRFRHFSHFGSNATRGHFNDRHALLPQSRNGRRQALFDEGRCVGFGSYPLSTLHIQAALRRQFFACACSQNPQGSLSAHSQPIFQRFESPSSANAVHWSKETAFSVSHTHQTIPQQIYSPRRKSEIGSKTGTANVSKEGEGEKERKSDSGVESCRKRRKVETKERKGREKIRFEKADALRSQEKGIFMHIQRA